MSAIPQSSVPARSSTLDRYFARPGGAGTATPAPAADRSNHLPSVIHGPSDNSVGKPVQFQPHPEQTRILGLSIESEGRKWTTKHESSPSEPSESGWTTSGEETVRIDSGNPDDSLKVTIGTEFGVTDKGFTAKAKDHAVLETRIGDDKVGLSGDFTAKATLDAKGFKAGTNLTFGVEFAPGGPDGRSGLAGQVTDAVKGWTDDFFASHVEQADTEFVTSGAPPREPSDEESITAGESPREPASIFGMHVEEKVPTWKVESSVDEKGKREYAADLSGTYSIVSGNPGDRVDFDADATLTRTQDGVKASAGVETSLGTRMFGYETTFKAGLSGEAEFSDKGVKISPKPSFGFEFKDLDPSKPSLLSRAWETVKGWFW
jgi:hypothetical protein